MVGERAAGHKDSHFLAEHRRDLVFEPSDDTIPRELVHRDPAILGKPGQQAYSPGDSANPSERKWMLRSSASRKALPRPPTLICRKVSTRQRADIAPATMVT